MSVSVSAPLSSTARRLTATAAAAGALLAVAALPAAAADHPAHAHRQGVVISDVHLADPHPTRGHRSERVLNTEWVEITNNTRRDVNLDGWTLSDQHGHTYTFRHYRLDGRATVRVHTGYGHDTRRDLYQDRRTSVWDRRDTATLRNDHRRSVDSLSWDDTHRGPRPGHHHR
ncbi:hypothetical protein A8713_14140 [Streptomyces sp. SAT1]|uniref:lamin tail domain-containing protein n=1 Tax=Streptomyces sp. SAT1 TaxID=1849967 RepID=UPI0007DD4D22|nr:lamin tail domain-containing protein [Streptomyces sp. SAT1]ANH92164.1 hypothetical protein A8713_14140 [Streptomyces sp. SAT1]